MKKKSRTPREEPGTGQKKPFSFPALKFAAFSPAPAYPDFPRNLSRKAAAALSRRNIIPAFMPHCGILLLENHDNLPPPRLYEKRTARFHLGAGTN
jgi:hypothetical protein